MLSLASLCWPCSRPAAHHGGSAPADIFAAPERHVGETVARQRLVKFDGANRTCFRASAGAKTGRPRRCLPLSVRDPKLLPAVRGFTGTWAVEGKVDHAAAAPDRYETNFAWCRSIGSA